MKFRCVDSSIRLRLRRSEVDQLSKSGQVKEQIGFPGGILMDYEIIIGEQHDIDGFFEPGKFSIRLPESIAKQWISTDQISIEHQFEMPDGNQLKLLIEKDFPCKTRVDEDKADTFEELVPPEDQVKNC